MEIKFAAKREEICAGLLKKKGFRICRGILFKVDNLKIGDNEGIHIDPTIKISKDLMFTSPGYTINGFDSKFNLYPDFKIYNYVELGKLLEHEGYDANLTQRELDHIIYKYIISDYWLRHNMALFGWREVISGYNPDGIEILPMAMYNELDKICGHSFDPFEEEPNLNLIKRIR